MVNRRPDNMSALLRIAFEELMKGVHTVMPGVIVNYDSTTRRARVQGSLHLLKDDFQTTIQRAVISNVPVLFPLSSAFGLTFDLSAGDPVLLCFSQRGLSRWKQTHDPSPPDVDGFFSERDAIAIAGFGPAGKASPHSSIEADADGLTIAFGSVRIEMTAGGVNIVAPSLTHNGNPVL